MSDPRNSRQKPPTAQTARQEGAQGRTGQGPDDRASDGEIDASDPRMRARITDAPEDSHANA